MTLDDVALKGFLQHMRMFPSVGRVSYDETLALIDQAQKYNRLVARLRDECIEAIAADQLRVGRDRDSSTIRISVKDVENAINEVPIET